MAQFNILLGSVLDHEIMNTEQAPQRFNCHVITLESLSCSFGDEK